eukprot:886135-Heterocapsa_arctica.AAC.1
MLFSFHPVAPRGHSKASSMFVIFWSFLMTTLKTFMMRREISRSFMIFILLAPLLVHVLPSRPGRTRKACPQEDLVAVIDLVLDCSHDRIDALHLAEVDVGQA